MRTLSTWIIVCALCGCVSNDAVPDKGPAGGGSAPPPVRGFPKTPGGPLEDEGLGIAAFKDDYFFVTGHFKGTATWGAGQTNQTQYTAVAPHSNAFLARYNAKGELEWVNHIHCTSLAVGSSVSVVPSDGSCIVVGTFSGTATFGPGVQRTAAGGMNTFVARYRRDGALLWANQATNSFVSAKAVSASHDGSCVVTGFFSGTATFAPSVQRTAIARDIFVARYRPDGSLDWAKREGGAANDEGKGIAVFRDGSCVVTGNFRGWVNFGPGTPRTASGHRDVFVARYSKAGALQWVKQAGGPSPLTSGDTGTAITARDNGSCVATGLFFGTATFGPGVQKTAPNGGAFVAAWKPDGTLEWVQQISGTLTVVGQGVAAFHDGSLVATGEFSGTATFAPGVIRTAAGMDMFVARYEANGTLRWATRVGGPWVDRGYGVARFGSSSTVLTGATTLAAGAYLDIFIGRY